MKTEMRGDFEISTSRSKLMPSVFQASIGSREATVLEYTEGAYLELYATFGLMIFRIIVHK